MKMRKDSLKIKIIIMVVSIVLVLIGIGVFCLDTSMEWNAYKIGSCVIVSLWLMFIIPSLRMFFLEHEIEDMEYWIELGGRIGIGGLFLPVLITPYYGILYYRSGDKRFGGVTKR